MLPSGRNRLSAIFSNNESANSVETIQDRRYMSMKHEFKTVVALSTGDVTSGVKRPIAVETDIPP
jgi:hypothetical protein